MAASITSKISSIFFFLLALVALAVPMQITVGADAQHTGTRLNLADPIMAIGVLLTVWSLYTHRAYPAWRLRPMVGWLGLLTGIMTLSFTIGVITTGEVSTWALINRLVGWFILLGYFFVGSAARWFLSHEKTTHTLLAYIVPLWVSWIICGVAILVCHAMEIMPWRPFLYPLQGFAGDRNAAMLMYIFSLVAGIVLSATFFKAAWFRRFLYFILFLTPTLCYLNYSLSGMITLAILLSAMIVIYWQSVGRSILPWILSGLFLLPLVYHAFPVARPVMNITHRLKLVGQAVVVSDPKAPLYSSDNLRRETYLEALTMWFDHPLLGAGLGAHLHARQEAGKIVAIIDSTPLWLLAETGLVGFISFGFFAGFCLTALWASRRHLNLSERAWCHMGILMLAAFAIMSISLQLLYLRAFWFLMGLVLARPVLVHTDPRAHLSPYPNA